MKPIYLESDEEITTVIDKVAGAGDQNIALVVAKNSSLLQSLVNLKLLAKKAQELNVELTIITANKIGQKLARQVGLASFATLGSIAQGSVKDNINRSNTAVPTKADREVDETIDGVPVHQYVPNTQPHSHGVESIEPGISDEDEPHKIDEDFNTDSQDAPEVTAKTPQEENTELTKASPEVKEEEAKSSQETDLPSIVGRPYLKRSREKLVVPWKAVAVAGTIFIILSVIGFYFIPRARITLTLPAKSVDVTKEIVVTTEEKELSTGEIKGTLLTAQKTANRTITATGKKDIGAKASGTISAKNCEDTSAHNVPANTRVKSGDKTYIVGSAVTIPAGQFSSGGKVCTSSVVPIAITAELPGEAYNLSNATFQIPNLSGNFITSGSTTGGLTKQVNVLSQDDVTKTVEEVKAVLIQEAQKELTDKKGELTTLEGAFWTKVEQESLTKQVGAQTDTSEYSVSYTLGTIGYSRAEIDTYLKNELSAGVESGIELVFNGEFIPKTTFMSFSEGNGSFKASVSGSGFLVKTVDKNNAASLAAGKSKENAKTTLINSYQAEEVIISVTPAWWLDRLPTLSRNIVIEYGFLQREESQL